jgi:hypothetical protein
VARLSDIPRGEELEDFVAAHFQTAGFFVEKNIVQKEAEEILELDAVVTSYPGQLPDSILFEVKSGDWGFSDLFKQLGQMTYLKMPKGAFFTTTAPAHGDVTFYREKAASMGIRFLYVDNTKNANAVFESEGFPPVADPVAFKVWRFSFWVERRLLYQLRQFIKKAPKSVGPKEAIRYYRLVNNGVFFIQDIRERVYRLYSAYKEHPKLTLGNSSELAGKGYDPKEADPSTGFMKEALFEGKHPVLQASMYIEHRARLSILKAAVDYVCLKQAHLLPDKIVDGKINLQKLLFSILPLSFVDALKALEAFPHFKKLPHFWQAFLWSNGGFLLTDRLEAEYKTLSDQTGIPATDIENALEFYDILFPTSGSWFQNAKGTKFRLLKMVPLYFRGVGAFHRLSRNKFKEYAEFKITDYTSSDMIKWHNLVAKFLS